ncbi:MAG: thermonuclease family protein [Firmicutes bacterium]|nr:thermonuclease family protein [Bacillota bacterium]
MRKFFLTLLVVSIGFLVASCQEPEVTPIDEKYTLLDLTGKTEAEITQLFEGIDLTIIFRYIETNDVLDGYFIQYVGLNVGDQVDFGSSIRIEIATPAPSAPTIQGVEDVILYVSVQGNPPEFDLLEGIIATDFLGNDIPFGNFFYYTVQDSTEKFLSDVDYYKIGDYTVTYYAQNSGFTTSVVRNVSIVIPPFDTNHTDELRLTASYTGLSFIDDGIGEVEVTTFTDGDTTNFIDLVSGDRFTVRYLGIDAPEATSTYEPWGIEAAAFAREKLSGAEKIILQAEGDRTDGNSRYLAWVWYVKDGVTRLLNLELVEQAYAWTSGAVGTQYEDEFTIAGAETQLTQRRIYGEIDPNYDYSTSGTPIEIGALIDNFDTYVGSKVTITGVITSKVGNSIFIEQDGRGIYIYGGYEPHNELVVGYEVTIQGLVPSVYFNSMQLSNYKYENMKLESIDNIVIITTILGNQIGSYVGRVVNFENLTIQSISESPSDAAYTIYATDDQDNTISLRVDNYTASFLPSYNFVPGKHISVFGPVTQYYEGFQMMVPGVGNIVFKD